MSFELAELERKLANLIRIGTIAEVYAMAAKVKVKLDDELTTALLPWTTTRAGEQEFSWWMPEVGEQVVVFSPMGDLTQGVVMGSIYKKNQGLETGVHRVQYSDGSFIEYRHDGEMKIEASKNITISAGEKLNINCGGGSIEIDGSGNIEITGTRIDLNK